LPMKPTLWKIDIHRGLPVLRTVIRVGDLAETDVRSNSVRLVEIAGWL
jgi:hypothetical protein